MARVSSWTIAHRSRSDSSRLSSQAVHPKSVAHKTCSATAYSKSSCNHTVRERSIKDQPSRDCPGQSKSKSLQIAHSFPIVVGSAGQTAWHFRPIFSIRFDRYGPAVTFARSRVNKLQGIQ